MIKRLNPSIAVCVLILICVTFFWFSTQQQEQQQEGEDGLQYLFSNEPRLNRRLAQAEHLWRQSVDARQEMIAAYPSTTKFPDDYIYPYHVWDYARPSFFCPHDLERVGKLGDGGKVVCGMSRYEEKSPGPSGEVSTKGARPLIAYSFGINDDSSFEAALLNRTNVEIWGYDYSVKDWAGEVTAMRDAQRDRAHFHKAGIAKVTKEGGDPPMFSVQDIMEMNGHTYIDIMKMDIEGAEFDAMTSWINHVKAQAEERGEPPVLPVGQLLVEIHLQPPGSNGMFCPKTVVEWVDWFETLEELGLRPVNNEDNWIGDNVYGKPRFMEYTMINAIDKDRNKLL